MDSSAEEGGVPVDEEALWAVRDDPAHVDLSVVHLSDVMPTGVRAYVRAYKILVIYEVQDVVCLHCIWFLNDCRTCCPAMWYKRLDTSLSVDMAFPLLVATVWRLELCSTRCL